MRVEIPRQLLDEILEHARREAPNECCGLLLGVEGRVRAVHPARNALSSPTRYLVEPEDHFAALRRARTLGQSIVGVYHSHPRTPAVPSERDRDEAAYQEFLYLIVGLLDDTVRAYSLADRNFQPVELVPIT